MKTKVIAALVAGGLLVGAGFLTSVVSAPGTATAQESTDEGEQSEDGRGHGRALSFLNEVLTGLVASGDITQDQADTIIGAVETAAEEKKAERQATREAVEAAFEDGVATEQELLDAGLDPEHRIFTSDALEEAWADGELTSEELEEVKGDRRGGKFRKGARFGALFDDGGIDQAEFDELDDDHPLKQIDGVEELLSDGVITIDELKELREASRSEADTDSNA